MAIATATAPQSEYPDKRKAVGLQQILRDVTVGRGALYLNLVGAQVEELEVGQGGEGQHGHPGQEVGAEVQLHQVHQA